MAQYRLADLPIGTVFRVSDGRRGYIEFHELPTAVVVKMEEERKVERLPAEMAVTVVATVWQTAFVWLQEH